MAHRSSFHPPSVNAIFTVFCLVLEKSGCCVVNSMPTQFRKYPCDPFRNAMASQHYLALAVGSLPSCGFLAPRGWGGFFVSTNVFTLASLFVFNFKKRLA